MDLDEHRRQNEIGMRIGEQQQEMQLDIIRISSYGYRFPSSFVGFKFDGPSVVALFTELGPHQHDLPLLLDHPERVRIETSPHTRAQLEQVRDQLATMLAVEAPGAARSLGIGLTQVGVKLTGDEAALASKLYQQFGDAISVRLGNRVVDQAGNFVGPELHPRTV